jgi:hypothetical protein
MSHPNPTYDHLERDVEHAMVVCTRCAIAKTSEHFYPDATKRNELRSECKDCTRIDQGKRRRKSPPLWWGVPIEERFTRRIERVPFSTCWYWNGATYSKGYGQLWRDGQRISAHRLSFELFVGQIPPGLEINHLCETPCCVNPAHLEAVTHRENLAYSYREEQNTGKFKTHCKRGHEFSPENTLLVGPNRNFRQCRECNRQRARELRAIKKGVLA